MRPFATLPKPSILSRKHFKELPQNSRWAEFYPSNKKWIPTYANMCHVSSWALEKRCVRCTGHFGEFMVWARSLRIAENSQSEGRGIWQGRVPLDQVIWEGSSEEVTFGLRSEGSEKLGEAESRWRVLPGQRPGGRTEPGKLEDPKVADCGWRERGSGQRGRIQGPLLAVRDVGVLFFPGIPAASGMF